MLGARGTDRRSRLRARLRAGVLAAAAGLGCVVDTPATLCDTANAEIVLTARVEDSDTNVRVELAFAALGSAVSRPFCVDDSVEINGATATKIRKPSGNTVFAINLDEPASTYVIAVIREDVRHEVEASPAAPALALTAPNADAEPPRDAPLEIRWEPALGEADTITVIIQDAIGGTTCLEPLYRAEVPDLGVHEVAAGALTIAAGLLAEKAKCAAFVEVLREIELTLTSRRGEPFHADSRLIAATERARDILSIPTMP